MKAEKCVLIMCANRNKKCKRCNFYNKFKLKVHND